MKIVRRRQELEDEKINDAYKTNYSCAVHLSVYVTKLQNNIEWTLKASRASPFL
jgi:hypothetical protein